MKKLILLLLLTISISTFSQIKNGTVDYTIQRNNKIDPKEDAFMNEIEEDVRKEFETTIFTLNFNTNEATFYLNEPFNNKKLSLSEFLMFSYIGLEKYYNKVNSDSVMTYYNTSRFGIYKIKEFQKMDWQISNESKVINGYLCIKATALESPTSKRPFIAWFCPKIPVSFGPAGCHGLPGLVLVYSDYVNTYFVKSISLNLETEPNIDTFEGVKLVTEEYLKSKSRNNNN